MQSMPPRKKLLSLDSMATSVCVQLVRTASVSLEDKDRVSFHSNFTDKLPVGVREWLMWCLNRHFGPHAVFSAMDLLVGEGSNSVLKRLVFFEKGVIEEKLWLDDVMALYRSMERYNIAEQLTEISLAAKIDRLTEHCYVPFFNMTFPQLISRMAALTTFIMIGACDDRVLATLGRSCPNLLTVDVSESWQVTGRGLLGFIFCNEKFASSSQGRDFSGCQLNPCIPHVTLVNIKDTDVNSQAVEALLKYATSVTSIGGFFYHENIGSCFSRLYASDPSIQLELEELYDVCLTEEIVKIVDKCCPRLKKVATRGHCLPYLNNFTAIHELAVDFDFHDYSDVLEDFLLDHGFNLTSLETSDQPVPIDIRILQEACPNIKAILGRFTGQLTETLPSLTSARVVTDSVITATSLLCHAVNLETLVLKPLSWPYSRDRDKLEDNRFVGVFEENQQRLQHLKHFLIQEPTEITNQGLKLLMDNCPELTLVGQLRNFNLCTQDKEAWQQLQAQVNTKNLDLTLVPFCDNSLQVSIPKLLLKS